MPSVKEVYDKLEWSGLCRATPHRDFHNHYWAISDSGTPNDNRLYLVDEEGRLCATYSLLTSGGGILKNRDWEDITTDGLGHLWILENIHNSSNTHRILAFDEPSEFGQPIKMRKMFEFHYEGNVEALFFYNGSAYVITKKANSLSKDALFSYFDPQEIFTFEFDDGTSFKVKSRLKQVMSVDGCYGFCTSADMFSETNNRLLIHCYTKSYVIDWPDCKHLWQSNQGPFGQTEGACFTHDGQNILINNESGKYQKRSAKDFTYIRGLS